MFDGGFNNVYLFWDLLSGWPNAGWDSSGIAAGGSIVQALLK